MGSEALATGRNKLTDMAEPNAKLHDVSRRNVSDSAYRVLKRLRGQGSKRKRATSAKGGKQPSTCNKKNLKSDIFS